MKKWLLFLFLLSPFVKMEAQVDYLPTDSLQVCSLLRGCPSGLDAPSAALHFAKALMGTPYVAATLEHNETERLVVRLGEVDCTTFVNQVLSLTLASQKGERRFEDFCRNLRSLRYRGGEIRCYASRLHYYSEAIMDNERKGFYKEQGQERAAYPYTARQVIKVNYMSVHPSLYKPLQRDPSLLPAIIRQEKEITGKQVNYIPARHFANDRKLRAFIRDGDILVLVTNKKGLDTAHLGFAKWQNGHLHLLNASSIHKKVVLEPMTLYEYLKKHPSMPGVRVVRLTE